MAVEEALVKKVVWITSCGRLETGLKHAVELVKDGGDVLGDTFPSAFSTISAIHLDDAWARTDFFDFSAVVIDHELKNDIAASAFGQRFMTLKLEEDATPEAVVMELTGLFSPGSELVQ